MAIPVLNFNNIGCRNRCVFCSGVTSGINKTKNIDQIAKKMFNEIAPLIEKGKIKSLLIEGSDPIEYAGLLDFIEKIKRTGNVSLLLRSHGLAFADFSYWQKFSKIGNLKKISLPIYGHQAKLHDAITRNPGSFNALLKILRNFKKTKFPGVCIETLLLKQNANHLKKFFDFLLKLGYPLYLDLPDLTSSQPQNFKASLKNIPNLKKIRQFFIKYKGFKNKQNMVFARNVPFCLFPGLENIIFSGSFRRYGLKYYSKLRHKTSTGKKSELKNPLSKTPICRSCSLDNQCWGIAKPYLELKLFKPQPIKKHILKNIN